MARVFSELLNSPVEVTAPFFQLGASSLTLVLAHRRLVELDPALTVVDLFAHPTVRDLAVRLSPAAPAAPPEREAAVAAPPSRTRAEGRRAARARAAEVAG